jgi:hypothetical protein
MCRENVGIYLTLLVIVSRSVVAWFWLIETPGNHRKKLDTPDGDGILRGKWKMEETAQTNPDLLNLTRWVTLTFMILLIAVPRFQQLQKGTQSAAFGNAEALAYEKQAEDNWGTKLSSQYACFEHDEEIPAQAGIESEIGAPPASDIPGPMAPVKDMTDLVPRAPAPGSAGIPVPDSSSAQQQGANSKNDDSSVRKEKPAHPFEGIIHKAAERYEVDPALVKAIIMAESSYNPRAVSRKGARGLMQLMPRTARALGVEDSFDPEDNIDAGVRYFKQLLDQFKGNVKLAVAAYNAGSRKVRKYHGIPPFKYTRYYVAKVIEYHQTYQQ